MAEEKTNRELNMGAASKSQTSEGAGNSRTGGEPLDLKGIYEWVKDPVEWSKKLATEHWKEQKEIAQKQQNITDYDISGASLQKPEKTAEIKEIFINGLLSSPQPSVLRGKGLWESVPISSKTSPPLGETLQPPTDWSKEPLPPELEKRIEHDLRYRGDIWGNTNAEAEAMPHYDEDRNRIWPRHGRATAASQIKKRKNQFRKLRQNWSKQTKEQLLKEKEKWEEELKKKNSPFMPFIPDFLIIIDQLLITK